MQRLTIIATIVFALLAGCGPTGSGDNAPSNTAATAPPVATAPPAGGGSTIPSTAGWYQIANSKIEAVCAASNGFQQVWGASGCQ
ncbi:MAG: hypothetical protein ACKVQU_23350, partial [Burkholderiales bacterium]